jgi:chromosome segregation ATPase
MTNAELIRTCEKGHLSVETMLPWSCPLCALERAETELVRVGAEGANCYKQAVRLAQERADTWQQLGKAQSELTSARITIEALQQQIAVADVKVERAEAELGRWIENFGAEGILGEPKGDIKSALRWKRKLNDKLRQAQLKLAALREALADLCHALDAIGIGDDPRLCGSLLACDAALAATAPKE